MVRKSGAAATAARTGSCPLLRMPMPMRLSLEVRHDGVDILADPGTYCYHGEPAWREWFRSTAGHNTVELDGLNQAESGGPFLWTTQVRTTTLTCDVGEQPVQTWSAEHDGYLRLKNPTTHRRSVTLDSPQRRLTIVDTFDAAKAVPARLSWHFGPDVRVDANGAHATLSWQVGPDTRQGTLTLPADLEWTCLRAKVGPIGGWYSPRFAARVPATFPDRARNCARARPASSPSWSCLE